jgi:hypothetical protein
MQCCVKGLLARSCALTIIGHRCIGALKALYDFYRSECRDGSLDRSLTIASWTGAPKRQFEGNGCDDL